MEKESKLIVYGHNYCGQAMLLARTLKKAGIDHEWRDVMTGPEAWQTELLSLARGNLSVPTVVFPDGRVMVEPWPDQVVEALGVEKPSWLERLASLFR